MLEGLPGVGAIQLELCSVKEDGRSAPPKTTQPVQDVGAYLD